MTIADEMDLALDKVKVTLADARPELIWNQLTGGSNSMHSIYTPVRVAAAIARGQLLQAAAAELGGLPAMLGVSDGVITAPGRPQRHVRLAGRRRPRSPRPRPPTAKLKPQSQLKLVGTPQRRIDALDAVTGRKQFAMDLDVPGALPTMLCRPPTINGTALAVRNLAQVQAMPGITDVAIIPHTSFVAGGVAVRGKTFGQCIDAVDALDVVWGPGTADGKSDADVLSDLHKAELPLTPALPLDQRARPDVHVLLPPGRSARDQLRHRRRQGRQRRDLVEPEVADLGPGADRARSSACRSRASRCT